MASPTWLPQEVQPSSGGPSGGSSTAIASPASVSGGTATGSMHEPAQVKFANAPDYAVPSLTFSYNAGGSQQSASSSVINSNPSASPVVFQPPIPGSDSSSSGPSFSYKISQMAVGFLANQHLKSNMDTSSAVARAGPGSSASTSSQSLNNSSSSTVAASSTCKVGPTSWMHTVSSFTVPPGLSGAPGTPGPLGLVPAPLKNASPAIMDSNSSAVWRPSVSTAPAPSNQAIQHSIYPTHPSLPPISGSSQGHWLQHPQTGVMPRLPFSSYPAVYPTPFLLPTCGMPHLSVASNDSLPPGVPSVTNVGATPTSSAASGQQVVGASGMQTEPPSRIGTLRVYARLLIS